MGTTDYSRFRRLAHEGAWIFGGQLVSVLGTLVLVRVLTEYLGPEQYGQLALGLTISGLVNQVVMGGITAGVGRYYSIATEKKDIFGYLHASYRLMGFAAAAVFVMAVVLITALFFLGYPEWMGLAGAALVLSVLSGYNYCLGGIQNAARQRAVVAIHGGVEAWLKILLAIAVMFWLGNTSTAVVLAYALSSLLVSGSQSVFLSRLIRRQSKDINSGTNWIRQIWAYSLPFSMFGIFAWMQQISDRWALQTFASGEDVGLYTVLFQLGYVPIGLATGMATNFLGPILYQRSGAGSDSGRNISVHRLAWFATIVTVLMTAFAFILAFLVHKWAFNLLVAAEYRSISGFLPWMVLAGGLFAASQMLTLKLMSEIKPSIMTTAKVVTAIFGCCLNVYFAMQFGFQGVVFALVAFASVHFFWMAWLARTPAVPVDQRSRV